MIIPSAGGVTHDAVGSKKELGCVPEKDKLICRRIGNIGKEKKESPGYVIPADKRANQKPVRHHRTGRTFILLWTA